MKANELMIGDWVKLDFYDNAYADKEDAVWKNGKVTAIHHGNWVDVNFGDTLDECDILVCDIQPIPLTAEILEKNFHGYKRGSGALTHFIYELNEDFFIHASAGSIDLCIHYDDSEPAAHDDIYLVELRYAHELQHALRLFGIEKEIEL